MIKKLMRPTTYTIIITGVLRREKRNKKKYITKGLTIPHKKTAINYSQFRRNVTRKNQALYLIENNFNVDSFLILTGVLL